MLFVVIVMPLKLLAFVETRLVFRSWRANARLREKKAQSEAEKQKAMWTELLALFSNGF